MAEDQRALLPAGFIRSQRTAAKTLSSLEAECAMLLAQLTENSNNLGDVAREGTRFHNLAG